MSTVTVFTIWMEEKGDPVASSGMDRAGHWKEGRAGPHHHHHHQLTKLNAVEN
jgi:hypothetical protein